MSLHNIIHGGGPVVPFSLALSMSLRVCEGDFEMDSGVLVMCC